MAKVRRGSEHLQKVKGSRERERLTVLAMEVDDDSAFSRVYARFVVIPVV